MSLADWIGIDSRFTHSDKVIRDSLATQVGVFAELLVEKSDRLRALHGSDGVFPNADFGMVDKAFFLECSDEIPAEVLNSNDAVFFFGSGQIHAMKGK